MKLLSSYLQPHNSNIDERFHQLTCFNVLSAASFSSFLNVIERGGINGDIVECGIGRSRSLIILCSLVAGLGFQRRILAYDSFAGFPQPTIEDSSPRCPKSKEWSASPSGRYEYTEDFCRLVLQEAEIPLEHIDITIIKGFFSETLPLNDSKKIALLNIDGDLYQSYQDCLVYLFPKVEDGGIIIFDDFDDTEEQQIFPGARLAVREYLGEAEYKNIKKSKYGVFYYQK